MIPRRVQSLTRSSIFLPELRSATQILGRKSEMSVI